MLAKTPTTRLLFTCSAETQTLIEVLSDTNSDEVSYDSLSSRAGFDVLKVMWALGSARRYLERVDRVVWAAISGWGLKRLDDVGTGRSMRQFPQKAGRAATRGKRRFKAIQDFAGLPLKNKTEVLLDLTKCQAIQDAARKRKVDSIAIVKPLAIAAFVTAAKG